MLYETLQIERYAALVLPEWKLTPYVEVGPLKFGMTHEEVAEALQDEGLKIDDRFARFHDLGVTAYYGSQGTLACVSIHPLRGPRAVFEGFQLTGRLPSEIDSWIDNESPHTEFSLNQFSEPCFEEFGLLIRGEQVGDYYRSMPVLLGREWEEGFDDVTTTRIPSFEWGCRSVR